MPAIPIILDCDPGHDDALAIVVALARPELRLLGITTVAGNAELAATTRNALRVLTLLERPDIPVAAGADRPLLRGLEVAAAVHGSTGLDGAELPEPASEPRPEGAVEFLRATLLGSDRPVVLVPTGPLTNIALLLRAHPEVRSHIASICLMGGAIAEGNWTPAAEFNIWVDPDAAAVVFGSGLPTTMIGLDVTHQARFRPADVDRLAALGTPVARVFADLLDFFARFHADRYGWDGAPIHDAVAVAHLAMPGLVRTAPYRVEVVTEGEVGRGRTVVDTRGVAGSQPNAEVGLDLDRDRFVDLVIDAVDRVGAAGIVTEALRYVALGDSYTIGTSVGSAERFPDQLVRALGPTPPTLELVANLGVNGYTSADLIRTELPELAHLDPGFVTLLIGVNDVVRGVPASRYEANVRAILDELRGCLAADRIVAVAIPDYTATPAGGDYGDPRSKHDGIVAANRTMASLAEDRGIPFVDIFDLSLRARDDRTLVADDGLHPSGAQYGLWVERIAPAVRRLIGTAPTGS